MEKIIDSSKRITSDKSKKPPEPNFIFRKHEEQINFLRFFNENKNFFSGYGGGRMIVVDYIIYYNSFDNDLIHYNFTFSLIMTTSCTCLLHKY